MFSTPKSSRLRPTPWARDTTATTVMTAVSPYNRPAPGRHAVHSRTPVEHLAARFLGDPERMQRVARRSGRAAA